MTGTCSTRRCDVATRKEESLANGMSRQLLCRRRRDGFVCMRARFCPRIFGCVDSQLVDDCL
eukprot:4814132-Pleurochrysis_carterae.AAC.1